MMRLAFVRIRPPSLVKKLGGLKAVRKFSSASDVLTFPCTLEEEGTFPSLEYRMFFASSRAPTTSKGRISPWHDIPLDSLSNSLDSAGNKGPNNPFKWFNYVNEIPRGTREKMEIATKEPFNPIKQDVKKGKLRYFTYGDIPFNYGALPQTWEDPNEVQRDTGCKGDNDPVDVVELSQMPIPRGAVVPVRILGAMALIDEGETDWKILAISLLNPLWRSFTPADMVEQVRKWFRFYKTTDGKPENTFAFNGELRDEDYALSVIRNAHQSWKLLQQGGRTTDLYLGKQ